MSEGEFKNRIVRYQFTATESSRIKVEPCESIAITVLTEILDEARKDFPLADWEIKGWLDKDSVMEYLHSEQVKELIKWFLKWFGHDEK